MEIYNIDKMTIMASEGKVEVEEFRFQGVY